MTPFRTMLAVMIVAISVMLAAGCVGEPVEETKTTHPIVETTTVPSPSLTQTVITPAPTECPVPTNGTYWIMIDPISNIALGEPIIVNGTTNLPPRNILMVEITENAFHPGRRDIPVFSERVEIKTGDICVHAFSSRFNSTDFHAPTKILVKVTLVDSENNLQDSQLFELVNKTNSLVTDP